MDGEYFEFVAGMTRTGRGRRALSRLMEAERLHEEAYRIKRAVEEGLLPAVTPGAAQSIIRRTADDMEAAAFDLDTAEEWS